MKKKHSQMTITCVNLNEKKKHIEIWRMREKWHDFRKLKSDCKANRLRCLSMSTVNNTNILYIHRDID